MWTDMALYVTWFVMHVMILHAYWRYLLPVVLLYVCCYYFRKLLRRQLDIRGKAVLITGCDSGFGYHLAIRLADHGCTVFAGVLSESSEGAAKLRQMSEMHVIKLDVASEQDVESAVGYVKQHIGQKELWGLVNNAGIKMMGDVELATIEQYKRCTDVNLFGMIRTTKAFLPFIRQSKGRIISVSSVKGRHPWPGDSLYTLSKYGMENISDCLRLEMVKFGVKVIVIEPGLFGAATNVIGPQACVRIKKDVEEMWATATEEVRTAYGRPYFDHISDSFSKKSPVKLSLSPKPVIDAIQDALTSDQPKCRYLVGASIIDKLVVVAKIYNVIPEWMSDYIIIKMTKCDSFP